VIPSEGESPIVTRPATEVVEEEWRRRWSRRQRRM